MKGIEEGSGHLVAARCDGAVDFEMPDHALDAVALVIDAPVPADRFIAVRTRQDGGADAIVMELAADRIGVVALIGDHIGGTGFGKRGYRFKLRAIRRFATAEVEDERDAVGITETMNLKAEAAPRAAKSLFASPPFAPAAETWPRTVVLSMLWRGLSAMAWASVEATASQMPAWLQRPKQRAMLFQLP